MTFQPVPVRLGSPHSFVMGVWVLCSHLDHTALRSHELSSLSLAEEGFFQVETLFGDSILKPGGFLCLFV